MNNYNQNRSWDILSLASHGLRNPIAGLKLQAEMAKRSIDTQGEETLSAVKVKKIIDKFQNDIDRLHRLVDDMLDVALIDNEKLAMKFEYFNLDEFLFGVISRLSQTFPSFDEQVKASINTPVLVKWDMVRMEQVISNIMCNAFRYGNGSQIKFSSSFDDRNILISIKDDGPGISQDEQANLFERNKPRPSKKSSSLGLGLYIGQEIVKAHRGKIEVKSTLSVGSTFTIVIPFNELNYSIKP